MLKPSTKDHSPLAAQVYATCENYLGKEFSLFMNVYKRIGVPVRIIRQHEFVNGSEDDCVVVVDRDELLHHLKQNFRMTLSIKRTV